MHLLQLIVVDLLSECLEGEVYEPFHKEAVIHVNSSHESHLLVFIDLVTP